MVIVKISKDVINKQREKYIHINEKYIPYAFVNVIFQHLSHKDLCNWNKLHWSMIIIIWICSLFINLNCIICTNTHWKKDFFYQWTIYSIHDHVDELIKYSYTLWVRWVFVHVLLIKKSSINFSSYLSWLRPTNRESQCVSSVNF